MQKKKKVIIISTAAAVVIIAAAAVLIFMLLNEGGASSDKGTVYVEAVSTLSGAGNNTGVLNRYTGVVDPQETLEVQKSSDKTVKEILVKEGDEVSAGTPLFTYDTDEISLKLSQAELDLEGLNNDISALYTQISQTEKEKAKAPQSEQLSYTTQIQSLQNDVRRAEYNKKSKQVEIEQIKASLNNATVTSEIAGAVKSINPEGTDNFGNSAPFMTIIATGNYRIKGKANEQNMRTLYEGEPVIIHSRLDETQTWKGQISKIDNEPAQNDPNGTIIYSNSSGNEPSSNYNFYVELEDASADLILGQHVYIEPDAGQTETKEGIWLMEGYFVIDGNNAYAWVKNSKNKLEKRAVTLGDYDSELGEYEVLSGLTAEDYIAWPMASFEEGLNCTTDMSKANYTEDNTDGGMDDMNDGMDGMNGGMDDNTDGNIDGNIVDDSSDGGLTVGGGDDGSDGSMDDDGTTDDSSSDGGGSDADGDNGSDAAGMNSMSETAAIGGASSADGQ